MGDPMIDFYNFEHYWGGHHARERYAFRGKLSVRRTRLNAGGYTSRGRYFGTGAPLFNVTGDDADDYVDFDKMRINLSYNK